MKGIHVSTPHPVQKKSNGKKIALIGCGGCAGLTILFLIFGGIIAALSGGAPEEAPSKAPTTQSAPAATTETPKAKATTEAPKAAETTEAPKAAETTEAPKKEESKSDVPEEGEQALASAENYISFMPFSKKGLFEQLTSEYGDGFPKDAAQYAVDNVNADWKANAVKSAKVYRDDLNMSKSAIKDQLTSEYGDKYTEEEAEYAIEQMDD